MAPPIFTSFDEAWRWFSDPAEAEDLCEQVFLKAWEAIGRYTWYGYPFSSWLYRLAHNLVVDHYRTRREILPLNDTLIIREEPIDPEVALARSLGSDDLRRAILRLTPADVERDGGNGGEEIRNWITVMAAADCRPGELMGYEDVADWVCGAGVVFWDLTKNGNGAH